MSDFKTQVLILTSHQRITGDIALLPGARLTDYMCEAKTFFAVTDAVVDDLEGRRIMTAGFLNIHRDHSHLIVQTEKATVVPGAPSGTGG